MSLERETDTSLGEDVLPQLGERRGAGGRRAGLGRTLQKTCDGDGEGGGAFVRTSRERNEKHDGKSMSLEHREKETTGRRKQSPPRLNDSKALWCGGGGGGAFVRTSRERNEKCDGEYSPCSRMRR